MTVHVHLNKSRHRPGVQLVRHGEDMLREVLIQLSADDADELALELLAAAMLLREGTGRRMSDRTKADLRRMADGVKA